MTNSRRTVSHAGERALVARVAARLGSPPPGEVWTGDDAALVRGPERLLLTTDMLVEGVDFDLAYASGEDVGLKAMAANVSDIAAMCGRPLHAVCAVGLRADLDAAWAHGLIEGLLEGARRWDLRLVGGDVGGAGEVSVALTVTGVPLARTPVLRSGARPGDALCVTGSLGAARAGLEVLRRGEVGETVAPLVRAQLRPRPRVAEAAVLAPFRPHAMLDLSDGLAEDLGRLLDASGVGCQVKAEAIPFCPAIAEVEGLDPLETAILGGEDYELLFAIGEDKWVEAERALKQAGSTATRIGTISAGGTRVAGRPLEEWRQRAWRHLST